MTDEDVKRREAALVQKTVSELESLREEFERGRTVVPIKRLPTPDFGPGFSESLEGCLEDNAPSSVALGKRVLR